MVSGALWGEGGPSPSWPQLQRHLKMESLAMDVAWTSHDEHPLLTLPPTQE